MFLNQLRNKKKIYWIILC